MIGAVLLVRRDNADPELAARAARASQSHIGLARHLATDADAWDRRRRLLLAGDANAAAASLIEEMECAAAVGAACGTGFSAEQQGALSVLLPRSCTEVLAAPEAQQMLRRIARLAEVRQ